MLEQWYFVTDTKVNHFQLGMRLYKLISNLTQSDNWLVVQINNLALLQKLCFQHW